MKYDLLIVGAGPAGLTAAIHARARDKSALVISNDPLASPLCRAPAMANYPGLPGVTGRELVERLLAQAKDMGAEFKQGRTLSVMPMGKSVMVSVENDAVEGRAVILATGVSRAAPLKGEAELLGRGVSYCATCDGMLYRNRPVTVVGLAPDAPQEANYLRSLGCQVVYVSPRQPQGLDETIPYVKAGKLAIKGEQTVTGLEADGALLPCAGVFILRRVVAPVDLLPTLATEEGVIKVDRRMATNVPGVFAAGDCTGGPLQVSKAVGEGHVAALAACEYLDLQSQPLAAPAK